MSLATVVNPSRRLTEYLATHAANKLTKTIIAVATTQYASQLKGLAAAFPDINCISAAVDTVPLGCQRNGFSWLVSEHEAKVSTIAESAQNNQRQQSRGWQASTSVLRMSTASGQLDVAVPLANTLFDTGSEAELYASGISGPLNGVHVELPVNIQSQWGIRPLNALTEKLTITSVADNMLKTLDGAAAASFLQNAHELVNPENKEREVFAELGSGEYVKVVAGGGGLWSPRASMLVLEPPASPRVGETIQFHLSTYSLDEDMKSLLGSSKDSIVAEIPSVPQTLDEQNPYLDFRKNFFIPTFGFGSERGIIINGNKHSIVGESLHFKLSSL